MPGEVGALVGDEPVLVQEHDEVLRPVDEQAGLAVDRDLVDDRALLGGLLDEAVVDRTSSLREHHPRLRWIAVQNGCESIRPHEDRVGLAAEVEQLEADAPLGLVSADPLAEVEPLRAHVGERVDALDGRPADVEDLEERAAGAGREREHAGDDSREDREAERERAHERCACGPVLEFELEAGRRRVGDLAAELLQPALELVHAVSPSCSRSRPSAREVRDLTVPRRSESTSAVSSSPRSSR